MTDDSELPLFVFGTLMDPDVFDLVTGRRLASYVTRPARLDAMARRRAAGEHYPVLVPDPSASVDGFVVEGLAGEALSRARFFEGEEFELERGRVRLIAGDVVIEARFFADRTNDEHTDQPWRLVDWQRDAKAALMPRIRRYMSCYAKMDVAEADAYW